MASSDGDRIEMRNNAMDMKQTSNSMSKEGNKGERQNKQDEDNNMVAPAWTKTTNKITCRNHGKESTQHPTCYTCRHEMEFRMVFDMEMRWGCQVTQGERKKKERQKQKGEI